MKFSILGKFVFLESAVGKKRIYAAAMVRGSGGGKQIEARKNLKKFIGKFVQKHKIAQKNLFWRTPPLADFTIFHKFYSSSLNFSPNSETGTPIPL